MNREKDAPPPYSVVTGPQLGFSVPPPNQAPPPQAYPHQPGFGPQAGYPPGFAPPPPLNQPAATVVVTTIPRIAQFGPTPQPTTCPHCHAQITSRVEIESGMKTHLIALIMCIIGCIPCCLIPYCVDSCQNRNHYCPNCSAYLGCYDGDLSGRGSW